MKKIAIIAGDQSGIGGINTSLKRHLELLNEEYFFNFYYFQKSKDLWPLYATIDCVDSSNKNSKTFLITGSSQFEGLKTGPELRYARIAKILTHHIVEEKTELIHCFGAYGKSPLIASYVKALTQIPLLISFRGTDVEIKIFGDQLSKLILALKNADAVSILNNTAKNLIKNFFQFQGPIFSLKNSIAFSDCPDIKRFTEKTLRIISFGEFRSVFGIDTLMGATLNFSKRYAIQLTLVGKFRKEVESFYTDLIDNTELKNFIQVRSPLTHDELRSLTQQFDIAIFPSLFDACPNKLLEAMACRIPIVAARADGISEILSDECAVLFNIDDPLDLEKKLEAIVNGEIDCNKMTVNAFERVKHLYSFNDERSQWLQIYSSLLQNLN